MRETPPRRPRQRLSPDARRAAMVAEAQLLLAHESPEQLTIDLIATRIGASPGLVHHYFGTKDGLVVAALTAAADEVVAVLTLDPDSRHTPREQLIGSLGRYLDYIEAHPVSWSTLLRASSTAAAAVADRVDQRALDFNLEVLLPGQDAPAALRAAISGWVVLVKEVCWRWLNDDNLSRAQAEELLARLHVSCLRAAAAIDPAARPALETLEGR